MLTQNCQRRSNNISSQHVLGFTFVDCVTTEITKLSKGPVSFPIIMPPTSKKLTGHIAFGLSIGASIRSKLA